MMIHFRKHFDCQFGHEVSKVVHTGCQCRNYLYISFCQGPPFCSEFFTMIFLQSGVCTMYNIALTDALLLNSFLRINCML